MAKNLISDPIFCCFAKIWGPKFFSWILPLLDVRHCRKLSSYSISQKAHDPNLIKWVKISFWAWFRLVGAEFRPPNSFQSSSVTKYHGQLSSCKTLEKTNDSSLKKLLTEKWTDGRMDEQRERERDRQMDQRDFIGVVCSELLICRPFMA